LRFAITSPPSGCEKDFHLQAVEHARHTLEGVGTTPKPTIHTQKEQVYVSQPHYLDRLYRPGTKDIRHTIRQGDHALSVATTRRYQQDSEWKEKTQWHDCVVYGGAAQYAANLAKGTHVFIEGELTYREYSRIINSESGPINVQWPIAEIVVESIKILDRNRKENTETEEPLSGSL
jgi:single-strand DNA-binding protein